MPCGLCWVLEVAGGKSVSVASLCHQKKTPGVPVKRGWGQCNTSGDPVLYSHVQTAQRRHPNRPAQGDKQNRRNTDQARDELKFQKAHYRAC